MRVPKRSRSPLRKAVAAERVRGVIGDDVAAAAEDVGGHLGAPLHEILEGGVTKLDDSRGGVAEG